MGLQSFKAFLEHGGLSSGLIILTAIGLLVLSIDRIATLYMKMSFDSKAILIKIKDTVLQRRYNQALQICNQQAENPELFVIRSGILAAENGREAMKSALSEAVLKISHRCETRLVFLSLIASAATLLGLLGTISGLIKTFSGLAAADAAEKSKLLGSGIAEAMNATAMGLFLGLIAMFIHTLCVSRADHLIAKAQSAALNLCNWIEEAERFKKHG